MLSVAGAQYRQTQAARRARQALGTSDAEAELARRTDLLAEARAQLVLLESGSRPERIAAARARLARLKEEVNYLDTLAAQLSICSPISGLVVTNGLKHTVGRYFQQGELICQIDEPSVLEAEIILPEHQVAKIRPGQRVQLKIRALPFAKFPAEVERIAPIAVAGIVHSTVSVYCRIENPRGQLKPGMSGYARIYCGRAPIGKVLAGRIWRYLRTDIWW